jgi:hypothetical protein
VIEAAKAYADTYFSNDDGRDKYLAVVSFGYGARVHVPASLANDYALTANADGKGKLISPNTPKTNVDDFYIGGYRVNGGHAALYKEADEKYNSVLSGNVKAFFFGKSAAGNVTFGGKSVNLSEIDILFDNISYYSGTNNEAGMLLAMDLLDRVDSSPYKNIVTVSDGESPATSTFAWLSERPLTGVHLGNVYEYTEDTQYADSLYSLAAYDGNDRNINFFDGVWHTADSASMLIVRAGDMVAKAKEIVKRANDAGIAFEEGLDVYFNELPSGNPGWTTAGALDIVDVLAEPAPDPLVFVRNVHKLLDEKFGAYDESMGYIATGGAIEAKDAAFWNKAVKGLFWHGVTLTYPHNDRHDVPDVSQMPVSKKKVLKTIIFDYLENAGTAVNEYGSDSARRITGDSAERVKKKGYTLYYVAVGDSVKNPQALEGLSSNNDSTQHFFYIAKQNEAYDSEKPGYIGFEAAKRTFEKIALENLSPARGVTIRDRLAPGFETDVENIQNAVVTRCYYAEDGKTQLEDVLTNPKPAEGENGLYCFDVTRGDPVSIKIDGKSVDTSVGTLWDTKTAKDWAVNPGNLPVDLSSESVFYYKASVRFPVLADGEAIGNTWTDSNDGAYFDFDGGRSPNYISPQIRFPSGGGGGGGGTVTPPPAESEPEEEPDETGKVIAPPNSAEETDEGDETPPPVPPGTSVQPGTPDVPPVPYFPGSSLIPLDGGGFLEIDEDGVPLGTWKYDDDEEAWIFDDEVPLALLPQTGGVMPAAGFAYPWVFPLLSLLWLCLIWPRVRRCVKMFAR